MWDVFEVDSDADEHTAELFADRLVSTRRLTVQQRYPSQDFDIEIANDYDYDYDYDYDPTVTLCRPAA